MRIRLVFLLTLGTLSCGGSLRAGEEGTPSSPAPLPVLDSGTKINMEKAAVTVDLETIDYPGPSAGLPAIPWKEVGVRATVTCTFSMRCLETKSDETRFTMAFPIGYPEDPMAPWMNTARILDFEAEVEGKPHATTLRAWTVPSEDGSLIHYFGHVWETSIRRDALLPVKAVYSLYIPFDGKKSGFTYILRSAAGWTGALGHETVRMKATPDLKIEPHGCKQFACVKQTDGSYLWEVRDAVPRENTHVTIERVTPPARH